MSVIRVAVGIILRNDHVFLAFRSAKQDQGGLWEFPGGKCEAGELASDTLKRELKEECGIQVKEYGSFFTVSHDYGSKQVELIFFKVTDFLGEPEGKEGQQVSWVSIENLRDYHFPDANKVIVDMLTS